MLTGLFFGSFNPVHLGHLAIARYFLEQHLMEEVWLVVSPQNPHKSNQELAPEAHRLKMAQLAIDGDVRLAVCALEFELPRPSYTIDTLEKLKKLYPNKEFALIIGSDNLEKLPGWKRGTQILANWPVYVYDRGGFVPEWINTYPSIHFCKSPLLPVSATLVREGIRSGKPIKQLLPDKVYNYIREQHLYK